MVHKLIGFYGDRPAYTPNTTDQLALEIGHHQLVLLVKNPMNAQIEAIELFQLEKTKADWTDIFFEVKQQSHILGFNFASTNIHYNFDESLMLPVEKLSATASEEYLSLVYGIDDRSVIKYDLFKNTVPFVTVYRIKQAVMELLNRNFLLFTAEHVYTSILNDVMDRPSLPAVFLKLIVYSQHIVVVLVKDKQLQLIQSFQFQTSDDILYYTLNIVQQSGLSALQTHVEISGLIDRLPSLVEQIRHSFGIVEFDHVPLDGIHQSSAAHYSSYYFTPFYKLMV
jgi:hypothetical protein